MTQLEPSWGVAAAPVSDVDLFIWHCNVAGQPPQGGPPVVLHLELTFAEDYPNRPPKVEVLGSSVSHPNVFSTFICLDMLEGGEWAADAEKLRPYTGWSSAYSILAILRQLQTFFFEGDGTQWWACTRCTLYNPIKARRCEACEQPRGRIGEIAIDVSHHPGFRCRCGHTHDGVPHPPFPDPANCDDAPTSAPPPACCPEDACMICLGSLDDAPEEGPLRGAPCVRPLALLVDTAGVEVCRHWFHLPCSLELAVKRCPLCRASFDSVAERKRQAAASLLAGSGALLPSPVLCGAARVRMAQLVGWPPALVVLVMSFVRRQDRSALAAAVPAWREAAQAPAFWESQELECFHEKTGPDVDTIGIGIHADGRGRLAKLVAHFDAVSLTAWRGGLRRAAWKEPMTHWLPLFVHSAHAKEAAPHLHESLQFLAQCTPGGHESHLPPPVLHSLAAAEAPAAAANAAAVLPELMHQLLKQVLDGDRHASLKLLKGYFVLHRLFLHVCDEWPAIRDAADAALRVFAESAEQRARSVMPWLAYILQLLTISNVGWEAVRVPYIEESFARLVPMIRAAHPNWRPVDPDAVEASHAAPPSDPFHEWQLSESAHGCERDPGTVGARELSPGTWLGRPRGWCCLTGAPRCARGRHAISVRVLRLPADAVLRIGWTVDEDDGPLGGWCYYASRSCFGGRGWKVHGARGWTGYGEGFREGDIVTGCVDQGVISFQRNGRDLGFAFRGPVGAEYRPVVALRRRAEVQLLPGEESAAAGLFSNRYPRAAPRHGVGRQVEPSRQHPRHVPGLLPVAGAAAWQGQARLAQPRAQVRLAPRLPVAGDVRGPEGAVRRDPPGHRPARP